MAGLDDLADTGADKGKDAMQDEGTTDTGLDAAEKGADKVTGGSHDQRLDDARDQADKRLGS